MMTVTSAGKLVVGSWEMMRALGVFNPVWFA
jgi:hypothetical protein